MPGAARALGLPGGRIVALAAPRTVQGVELRRFTVVGGDCDPSARAPRGGAVVHLQQDCVAAERTLWRAAEGADSGAAPLRRAGDARWAGTPRIGSTARLLDPPAEH